MESPPGLVDKEESEYGGKDGQSAYSGRAVDLISAQLGADMKALAFPKFSVPSQIFIYICMCVCMQQVTLHAAYS